MGGPGVDMARTQALPLRGSDDEAQRQTGNGTLNARGIMPPLSSHAPHLPLEEDASGALPHTRIFTALLTDLRRSARRLARSGEDADDLVQDTLLRVWSRMAISFEAGPDPEPSAMPIDDLRAYAFATLRHRAFRRGSFAPPADIEAEDIVALRGSDGVTRLACAEALAALAALPNDQQVLLRMRAMDGFSYADIAQKTGLPLGTVTSRLARGRASLRTTLDLPPGAPVTDLLGGV